MLPEQWESLTLESSQSKQIDEFVKKYRHTYVWIDKKHLVSFDAYEENYLYFSGEGGKNYKLVYNSDHTIDVWFPITGLFTYGNSLAFFSRKPARQYRKAPCQDNCSIVFPIHRFQGGHGMPNSFNFSTLKEAFSPLYFDYAIAVREILDSKTKLLGAALNDKWGVMICPNKKDQLFFMYYDQPIGYCDVKKIQLAVPEMKQEVLDFVRLMDLSIEVA